MATLTTQVITRAGIDPTLAAASAGGDSFTPGEDTYLHINNGSGGAITVTVVGRGSVISDVDFPDVVKVVNAGVDCKIGAFPAQWFADPADGLADITYSGVTSLTVGVFKL